RLLQQPRRARGGLPLPAPRALPDRPHHDAARRPLLRGAERRSGPEPSALPRAARAPHDLRGDHAMTADWIDVLAYWIALPIAVVLTAHGLDDLCIDLFYYLRGLSRS